MQPRVVRGEEEAPASRSLQPRQLTTNATNVESKIEKKNNRKMASSIYPHRPCVRLRGGSTFAAERRCAKAADHSGQPHASRPPVFAPRAGWLCAGDGPPGGKYNPKWYQKEEKIIPDIRKAERRERERRRTRKGEEGQGERRRRGDPRHVKTSSLARSSYDCSCCNLNREQQFFGNTKNGVCRRDSAYLRVLCVPTPLTSTLHLPLSPSRRRKRRRRRTRRMSGSRTQ